MSVETALPVTVSARAAKRIGEILKAEPAPAMLRVAVTGGGCSGFQYNFAIDDARMDDDLAVERDGVTVLIDPVSLDFLKGAEWSRMPYEEPVKGGVLPTIPLPYLLPALGLFALGLLLVKSLKEAEPHPEMPPPN